MNRGRPWTSFRKKLLIATLAVTAALGPATHVRAAHAAPAAQPIAADQALALGSPWWKGAVFYEIYPRSFQDTNGDGIGDINGIVQRLDYLQSLHVNAIWLTPIYPSPQVDFGYDISNYEAIDPMYGTMADFDHLLAAAKAHHIRILMDMVMNHTSDQHPWFKESRSSRTNPRRDWYIWRDGKGPGIPPNNWESWFGGSAWTYDKTTGQWYYHKYYSQQPDLNWRNPAVQQAMFKVVRFWLDKGVAGFRLDAVPELFEDPELRDEKYLPGINALGQRNQLRNRTEMLPEVHNVMRALRRVIDSYPGDRVLIGETYLPNIKDQLAWYGANNDELQLPMDVQVGMIDKLDAGLFREKINQAETGLDGYIPLFVFDNHDQPRSWNRYGDGLHDAAIARIVAAILLTTRATALMYYGQEIGMVTTPPRTRADVRDPVGRVGWPKDKGRDGERTPMQWTPGKNAGFSTAEKTWLPIPPSYKTVNVEVESTRPGSLLTWYKQLLDLRRNNPAMSAKARTIMVNIHDPNVLSYLRRNPGSGPSVLVAMNFTGEARTVSYNLKPQGIAGTRAKMLMENGGIARDVDLRHLALPPFGVFIGQVQ